MKVTKGSGNVFADLQLADAEEPFLKAKLAAEIGRITACRKLTQRAAKLMGVDQPKVSHVLHRRLGGLSSARLMTWLTALRQDVDIGGPYADAASPRPSACSRLCSPLTLTPLPPGSARRRL